jgi:hypothetical protein
VGHLKKPGGGWVAGLRPARPNALARHVAVTVAHRGMDWEAKWSSLDALTRGPWDTGASRPGSRFVETNLGTCSVYRRIRSIDR